MASAPLQWRKHRRELDYLNGVDSRTGGYSPSREDSVRRENDRWSEELYEMMLDRSDRRGNRKMKNTEQERKRSAFQNAMSRAGGAYKK